MEAEPKEGDRQIVKLENLDTKKFKETEVHSEEAGLIVKEDKVVAREPQEPTVIEDTKEEPESFRFAAAVSSTWIPSVVGDQRQKIFLKSGEGFQQSLNNINM